MFIGEADSLFPLYSVHGWECWLTRVCAPKEGHHFFAQVASKWETLLQTQLQKWPALCSTLKMSFSKCLQFYHFTFYSSTLSRAEQSDSWSERWHSHMEGVFQWSWKSPCAHSHPWIWIQIPPSALPKHSHILCGLSAPAEMGRLWWQLWVWGSEWILCQVCNCSDYIQHVVWKLISSLKLQVKSVQVTGDISDNSCVIKHGSSSSGSRFPLLSRKVQISRNRLRNCSSTFPRNNHLPSLCISK